MNARTAGDLMSKRLVSIGPHDTLRQAIALMVEHHLGALPVVAHGNCVGMISASDILGEQNDQEKNTEDGVSVGAYYNPDSGGVERIRIYCPYDEIPDEPVREAMNRDVIFVLPSASVEDVADTMVRQKIHHVLVMDEERRLMGIISSLDMVQLLVE